MNLNNKVIIVTGAGGGIGQYTSLKLAELGATVVCTDINPSTAQKTAETIQANGGKASWLNTDTANAEEVKAMVDTAVANHGTLTGIFNNAGIGIRKPLLEHDPETYHKVVNINQHGVYYGIYYAAKKMQELGVAGTIVNNASIHGFSASVGVFSYHTSKAAVVMMTKAAAAELAPYGIRVVGVAPGFIKTAILPDDPEIIAQIGMRHLRKKIILPEQVADVVTFLFSEASDAINGTVIPVDDGYLASK